jgi:UDP-N-acetylmuramyl pentapeptide synthase
MPNIGEEALYDIYSKHPQICIDSRKVIDGDLFFGLAGTQVQGNRYAAAALESGAAYAIVDDPSAVKPCWCLIALLPFRIWQLNTAAAARCPY